MSQASEYGRITGLTSASGKAMNGTVVKVKKTNASSRNPEQRLVVGSIDGRPGGPVKVKRKNLWMIDKSNVECINFAMCRESLVECDIQFEMLVGDLSLGHLFMTGGCARSNGILQLLEENISTDNFFLNDRNMSFVFCIPDLNLTKALNRLALNQPVSLAEPLNERLQRVQRLMIQNGWTDTNTDDWASKHIYFKYAPARCAPEAFEPPKRAKARVNAVKHGRYHIYPCVFRLQTNCMEVQYYGYDPQEDPSQQKTVCCDLYMDFGSEEALMYPLHAYSLGELDRLRPDILAEVDPDMFWALVLRAHQLEPIFNGLGRNDIAEEWKVMADGAKAARSNLRKCQFLEFNPGFGGYLKLVPGTSVFRLRDEQEQLDLALDNMILAFMFLCEDKDYGCSLGCTKPWPKWECDPLKYSEEEDTMVHILNSFQTIHLLEAQTRRVNPYRRAELLYESFVAQGFNDVDIGDSSHPGPKQVCRHCGSTDLRKLQECGDCGLTLYCSRKCQKKDWESHQSRCTRLEANAERILRFLQWRMATELSR